MKWNIGKILNKRAIIAPNKVAIIYEDTPITYKALNEESNRVGNFFREKGLRKGDRIAVDLLNCPEFLACYFAAAKLGLIFVPLNFRLVSRELEYQLNACACRLLVFHNEFAKYVEPIRSSIYVDKDKIICIKRNRLEKHNCPKWAADYEESIKSCSADEPEPVDPIDMDDPLAILYTSGVSGDPKGAVISHGQTYFKNFQIIDYTDMRQDDVFLFQSPLCHSAGLCAVATPALCRGATLLIRAQFDPAQFASDIEKYRATIIFGLTTMFRFVLETGALDHIDVSSVRVMFGGGERTPEKLIEELSEKGLNLQTGFGQTENSAMVLMPKYAVKSKRGSCGLPNFFSDVWIQNKQGERLPPGETGEIVATGPNVMSGYWNRPQETEETIVDGVLHTGDMGYTDEDGFFYIVGRAKDMYRSGAENVYPAEVEKILADHPKIENVAIIGVPDEKWGETGMAFIVCRKGETINREEVVTFLDGKIAKFKFP
ncbi:MAG: AMP-dependent synthetase, partial [Desulfobacteraceae bacterium 4572_187]